MPRDGNAYAELIRAFPLRPIRSDRQLERASRIVFELATRRSLTRDERDYLEVLSDLIERYEDRHHPIRDVPSGVSALRYVIDENQLTLSRLGADVGIRVSTLSEILRGKRSLSLRHVEKLSGYFRVEPGLFIQPSQRPVTAADRT